MTITVGNSTCTCARGRIDHSPMSPGYTVCMVHCNMHVTFALATCRQLSNSYACTGKRNYITESFMHSVYACMCGGH